MALELIIELKASLVEKSKCKLKTWVWIEAEMSNVFREVEVAILKKG